MKTTMKRTGYMPASTRMPKVANRIKSMPAKMNSLQPKRQMQMSRPIKSTRSTVSMPTVMRPMSSRKTIR